MGQNPSYVAKAILRESNASKEIEEFARLIIENTLKIASYTYNKRVYNQSSELSMKKWAYIETVDWDDQEVIDQILQAFNRKFGGKWFCMAGFHATFTSYPRPRKFLYFSCRADVVEQSFKKNEFSMIPVYRIFIYQE